MKIDDIKLLYEYNYWAHKRILNTATKVSEVQYFAPTVEGYRSLHVTLVHALDAEWSWRLCFEERVSEPTEPATMWDYPEITETDLPSLAAVTGKFGEQELKMRAYLNRLTDADLNRLVRYMIPGGIVRERVLWHCLVHVMNHGTQHRSEAAYLLTSYGESPGELDMTVFMNEYFNLQREE
ncbi:MAG: DinB family protein [Anaerolineae bacterium]|nr:DinB family protein [Anaerolineae bacterium]